MVPVCCCQGKQLDKHGPTAVLVYIKHGIGNNNVHP